MLLLLDAEVQRLLPGPSQGSTDLLWKPCSMKASLLIAVQGFLR